MASANGTTDKTAASMKSTAGKSRPATGGNKNVNAKARRTGHGVPSNLTKPLVGPDKGTG